MPLNPNSAHRKPPARSRRDIDDFDADAVRRAKTHTLQRNTLRRKARAHGYELRHSVYGYSLIDAGRTRVDGRNNLTLDEVETHLDGVLSARSAPAAKRSSRRA